jgi:hypothetical protein
MGRLLGRALCRPTGRQSYVRNPWVTASPEGIDLRRIGIPRSFVQNDFDSVVDYVGGS